MTSLCGSKCSVPFGDKDEVVTCGGSCKTKFHRNCSLLNKAAYDVLVKTSSLSYRCIKCQVEESTVSTLLEKLRLQLCKMERKTDDQFTVIDKRFTQMEAGMVAGEKQVREDITKVAEIHAGWTEVKRKPSKKKPPVIHITPKDKTQTSDSTKTAIKRVLNPANFAVQGMKNASNGSVLIECEDDQNCSTLLAQATLKLSDNFVVKKPAKRLPRIKLLKVCDAEENDDEFLKDLKEKNPFIGDKIELIRREEVKIRGKKIDNLSNVILQIDGETYNKVMEKGKLRSGYESPRVVDNIYIRRCYKCYGFNHNAVDCNRKAVCSRCTSTEHNFKECKSYEEKCTNCITTNTNLKMHLDVGHSVWSRECPVYKRKLEISKRGIQYVD